MSIGHSDDATFGQLRNANMPLVPRRYIGIESGMTRHGFNVKKQPQILKKIFISLNARDLETIQILSPPHSALAHHRNPRPGTWQRWGWHVFPDMRFRKIPLAAGTGIQ